MLPKKINLQVVTPQMLLVEESVDQVQLPGLNGELGILPGHAPLLTELGLGELSFKREGATRRLAVFEGYAEVLSDRVIVLAEVGEKAEDIDLERAKSAVGRAEKRLQTGDRDLDWTRAVSALQRALVRMQVAAKGGAYADHE